MSKAQEKQIKVNHTEITVPSAESQLSAEDVMKNGELVAEQLGVSGDDVAKAFTIPAEIAREISPVYLSEAEGWSGTLKKALETDDAAAWDKVFEIVYAIDQKKHKLPGLMKSKLARILERLP